MHQTAHTDAASVASFGALLRRYRLSSGLTQRELAERAGLSLRGINALELGHRQAPRMRTIARLADALGLMPDDRAAFEAAGRQRRRPGARTLILLPTPLPSAAGVHSATMAPDARPHNLPLQPTPLLGRERELAEVTALLRRHETRLVTLTGPGGVGKTRLAIEAAWTLLGDGDIFPDGIWLVRLAPLTDPALVIPSVAQALGLSESGGAPIADILRAFLREKSLLLILDNFEQVAEAALQVAEALEGSAGLKLLVTSRAALRLRGEHRYPVSLLAVPPSTPTHPTTAAQLNDYAATALFLQQAHAAQPSFHVTDATAPTVAAICTQLDGLPLAIELAATWTRLLPPAALLARLERRLPLLTDAPVDLPERQQTMRATIAWSYGLLRAEEQRLFRRLAVFVDGCSLAAAEAVCVAPLAAEPLALDTLEGVGRLADQSLIFQREVNDKADGEPRFSMLQVVREFALEQLEASGEAEALRHAHARYLTDFAERVEPELRGPNVSAWLAAIERELGNVRAALGWAQACGEVELGLRLATALWRFWFQGGHLSEGLQWLEALLAQASPEVMNLPMWLRARAQADRGMLLATQRKFGRAAPALEEGIALGREAGDWLALAVGLQFRGALLRITGQVEQAEACFEETLAIGRARGEALTIYTATASLAEIAFDREDWPTAAARYTEGMGVSQAAGHQDHVGLMLLRLGELALRQHDEWRAAAALRDAIGTLQTAGVVWTLTAVLDLLAVAYTRIGLEERAARIFGAAAAAHAAVAAPLVPAQQARIDALVNPIRIALSEGTWKQAYAAGRELTLEQICAEALAAPERATDETNHGAREARPTPQTARLGAERLTRRELEALRLLALGWTDAQIAAEMVISPRTVNHHVAAILSKLGVSSRAAATRLALERHLL